MTTRAGHVDPSDVLLVKSLKAVSRDFLSGEEVSRTLGISRAAVWKRIEGLRKKGYSVQSMRSKGYRFAEGEEAPYNGLEVGAALDTEFVGRPLYFYHEIDSTNIKAMELAALGASEGTAIVADSQSKGKGRLGRSWHSPPGVNLYTSVIFRPRIAPRDAPTLTLLFAVAVAEAIAAFSGSRTVEVKWPNDVLLDSRKAAGILTEMASDMESVEYVVCGVGVNLNMNGSDNEGATGRKTASLKEGPGPGLERAAFVGKLYSELEKWYKVYLTEGTGPVVEAWRGYFLAEGKRIVVDAMDKEIEGVCAGIDEAGALLVRLASGQVVTVSAGEMTVPA